MSLDEYLMVLIRTHNHLSGDCIRVLARVYEFPKSVSYNLKEMAETLKVERRSVRRHVTELESLGLLTYKSGRIRPVNLVKDLQDRGPKYASQI